MNLSSLLSDVAQRFRDYPAVTDGSRTLTYAEFFDRGARLAAAMRRSGINESDRVTLCMENCSEFLECLLACWIAGFCAVPINAKLHPREVEHIVTDSGSRCLFTTPGLIDALAHLAGTCEALDRVVCTRTQDYERMARGDAMQPVPAEASDRAWLFYTSGTTGRPKGAILSHRNLLFMSHAYYADVDSLDCDDVKLHTGALSHASGLYALPHMLRGGHQVVLPGFDVTAIEEALGRYRNVTMFAAPTMLTRLVHSSSAERINVKKIKTIYYGGGPTYVADLERALSIFGPRLVQIYGQGESPMTITALSKAMHRSMRDRDDLRSCGVPRTGVGVRIVDEHGHDLPPGEIGEVITRSDCVMEGYWNNPDATEKTLKGGWLHTGDLGSLDDRRYLTLRDRSKDLIISGGSNIYPREIEEVLLRHPSVLEASVIGRPHPEWGEEVVAFVVALPGAEVDACSLDELCLSQIARFKRPKAYRFVESLPKNNYGKILKTELRAQLQHEKLKD